MCGLEKIVQKFKGSRLKGGEKKRDGCFALLNMTEDRSSPVPTNILQLFIFQYPLVHWCTAKLVPYLTSLRDSIILTDDFNKKDEIAIFRLRMGILFSFPPRMSYV